MSSYDSWLKSCEKANKEIWKLESDGDIHLYQLITYNRQGLHCDDNYFYRQCTYHVWNVVTGKWFAYTDYRTAYNKYINCVNESKGNIQYVR